MCFPCERIRGGRPAARPKIVVVTAEQEYNAKETLPAFFKADVERKLGVKPTFINSDSTTDIPGLDALDDADLLVLYARRRTLPEDQLAKFRAYVKRGKPLVALAPARTRSKAGRSSTATCSAATTTITTAKTSP